MKSIEIIVPRNLIEGFYPHPEVYGDFIVELQNGMVTDVYYQEEGDFMTITSDQDLIDFINSQECPKTEFLYRNGVFALRDRKTQDKERLEHWKTQKSIKYTELLSVDLKWHLEFLDIPQKLIASFYWVEIGYIEFIQVEEGILFTLHVFEMESFDKLTRHNMLDELDIAIFIDIIKEYIRNKLPVI